MDGMVGKFRGAMKRKKLGLWWATMGLVAALGLYGLKAWPHDTTAWIAWWCVVVVVGTGVVITLRQKVSDGKNPNGHSTLLWEGAPYRCMHMVYPSSITTQCAWPLAHDLKKWPNEPTENERRVKVYVDEKGR